MTYFDAWKSFFETNRLGLAEILQINRFQEWDKNRFPESTAETELFYALQCFYAGAPEMAREFLRRTNAIVERAFSENKFESKDCKGGFPLNRGRAYRVHYYSKALSRGKEEQALLAAGSEDFEEWCKGYGKSDWDSQAQAYYLASVRMAILAQQFDRASHLLSLKRKFKWHSAEHDLLSRITNPGSMTESEVLAQIMNFLNAVRNPKFRPKVFTESEILRLDISAISLRCSPSPREIDWNEAISRIAR